MSNSKNTMPYEESAERLTGIVGWVCKTCRRYFGDDEHLARFCCAKDLPCDTDGCKGRKDRGYTMCDSCRGTMDLKRWLALPEVPWDGKLPLCLDDDDKYFFSEDDLLEYLAEHDLKAEDIRLVICEKRRPPMFDMYEFLEDYLAEGQESEADWDKISDRVNAWIKKNVPDVWEPAKARPTVDSLPKLEVRKT